MENSHGTGDGMEEPDGDCSVRIRTEGVRQLCSRSARSA